MRYKSLTYTLALLLLLSLIACTKQTVLYPLDEEKTAKKQDQPQEAQEFFVFKRAPDGETFLDYGRYEAARQQSENLPLYSSIQGRFIEPGSRASFQTWENLGPGNVGGRTRGLVIDYINPLIMYAAGVAGGVWKSFDGGANWAPLDDFMANLAVSTLVIDPVDPDILYAGTGEGFFNGDAVRGAGIFKTSDGGVSWFRLAATDNSNFHYVTDMAISPVDPARVYATTRTGIWRSLDSGISWSKVHGLISGFDRSAYYCKEIIVDAVLGQDRAIASCRSYSCDDGGSCSSNGRDDLWRNTDAGGAGTWDAQDIGDEDGFLPGDPGDGVDYDNAARISLASAPSDNNIIYALAYSNAGSLSPGMEAVYRSSDGGVNWSVQANYDISSDLFGRMIHSGLLYAPAPYCGASTSYRSQGWYDNVIAVDPLDPDIVWAGGIELFKSTNGGVNWGVASYWWIDPTVAGYTYTSPHADHHAIVYHPDFDGSSNTIMYVGNDGGIYKAGNSRAMATTDMGEVCPSLYSETEWIQDFAWEKLNHSYGVTQFYHGAAYPDAATYFGGTQDNGTNRSTDLAGINGWEEITGGDGGYVAVDPTNTDVLYTEYTGLSIQKSIDGGNNFSSATNGIDESNFLFINPFTMDPSNPDTLWTGGWYIWRTTDAAANWVKASAITPGAGKVSAHDVSPLNSNRVIVGMSDGFINYSSSALSDDGATTWPSVQPSSCYVSSINFDPMTEETAYATSSTFACAHVWKTSDGGANWTDITNNLPDIPAHDLVVDPRDTQKLYLATDLGVYVSLDGGASWAQENTGFANVITESLDLEQVGADYQLFAFTHGRGAWRVTLAGPSLASAIVNLGEDAQVNDAVHDFNDINTGTDTDNGANALNYSLTAGNDDGVFAINSSTGIVTVASTTNLDYETTTSYLLTVESGTANATLTVNISPVNDNAPVITSNGGTSTAEIDVIENNVVVTTVTATDADLPAQLLEFSLSGIDSVLFNVATTGVLSFNMAPSFIVAQDANADNVYQVSVTVSDGGLADQQEMAIRVLEEPPLFDDGFEDLPPLP